MKIIRRLFCIIFATLFTFTIMAFDKTTLASAEGNTENVKDDNKESTSQIIKNKELISYYKYLEENKSYEKVNNIIEIGVDNLVSDFGTNVEKKEYMNKKDVLFWDSVEGSLTWGFEVETEGLYNLKLLYNAVEFKGNRIELGLKIDGKAPFVEAENFTLNRLYKDKLRENILETGKFESDARGNNLRPAQEEIFDWQEGSVKNSDGLYDEPYFFYLSRGSHTIALNIIAEAIAIESLVFHNNSKAMSYQEYLKLTGEDGAVDSTGISEKFQAEHTYLKNDIILHPTEDRGSVATEPSHHYLVKYNTIGKNTFKYNGQRISWQISVPEDGYYNISFRARQDTNRGMNSSRRIYLDGEVLFEELNVVRFEYSTSWKMHDVADEKDEPYKFFLTAGKTHFLELEVVSGDMSEPLRKVEELVYDLNTWYRKIITITGSNVDALRPSVDVHRDFSLEQKIPGLMDGFKNISKELKELLKYIEGLNSGEGSAASTLSELIVMLDSFVAKPETIPKRLESYSNGISNLATWILEMREQPLEIDYINIYSLDASKGKAGSNVFVQLLFRLKMFFTSFVNDYSSVGNVYEGKALTVWVSASTLSANANTGIYSGREQAQIIKQMVDDLFVPQNDVGVNIALVNSSAVLVQATLAGKGPDVALFVDRDTPVNLAMRGALLDLKSFDGYQNDSKAFYESAIIPYQFEDGIYALPETQSYDMFFYRKDIFEELGLTPPNTWDEFYAILPILQNSNMNAAIYENQVTFESLIYQRDSQFYNNNLTASAFDTEEVLSAFKQWTGLYTQYGLPLIFDFFNRFRTGEMPCGIVGYTNYNYLNAAAPELRNLWEMTPIPGHYKDGYTREDYEYAKAEGKDYNHMINRSETCNSSGSIILADTKMPAEAYKFISWWTGAEAQARFGTDLEQLMGASARYPTANKEAFDRLPWSKKDAENLKTQWEQVTSIPQVPGNYYINRNISFAFRRVVYNRANERESLFRYNKEINKEIKRKREEFGLDR